MKSDKAKNVFSQYLDTEHGFIESPNEFPSQFAILKIYIEDADLKEHYKAVVEKHNQDIYTKKYPDSGFDLYTPTSVTFTEDNKAVFIDYLIRSQMIYYNGENNKMENCAFYMYPRSSFSKTPLILGNHVGVIDSGYRGHLMGAFKFFSSCEYPDEYIVDRHQRLLQVCHPSLCPVFVKILDTDNFEDTERGSGGFGSTGK